MLRKPLPTPRRAHLDGSNPAFNKHQRMPVRGTIRKEGAPKFYIMDFDVKIRCSLFLWTATFSFVEASALFPNSNYLFEIQEYLLLRNQAHHRLPQEWKIELPLLCYS